MKDKRQESNNCIKVCLFSFFKKKTTPSAEKNVHTSIPNIKKKKKKHCTSFSIFKKMCYFSEPEICTLIQ